MYGFNFELDDFQKDAIKHIQEGKSVVVCAPTGAGKTCIAQSAIHLALEKGERIFWNGKDFSKIMMSQFKSSMELES